MDVVIMSYYVHTQCDIERTRYLLVELLLVESFVVVRLSVMQLVVIVEVVDGSPDRSENLADTTLPKTVCYVIEIAGSHGLPDLIMMKMMMMMLQWHNSVTQGHRTIQ